MYHWIKINSALKRSHLKSGTVFCNPNLQFPNDFFPVALGRKSFYIKMMYEAGWKFMILSCCKSFVLICFVSILLKLMEIICHLACPSWFEKRKKTKKKQNPTGPFIRLAEGLVQVCLCLQSPRCIQYLEQLWILVCM